MLHVVSTPIGNLQDISQRALTTLQNCTLILCEDTRVTKVLLDHFQIKNELRSYHQWNEKDLLPEILARITAGESIALVSDAGTPLISDPGLMLVKAVVDADLAIDAIPGPCSPIVALTLSGLPTDRFQFVGFLPKKQQALQELLKDILGYPGTSIAFESPHRIQETLEQIFKIAPEHPLVIARELTKKFQTILRGTARSLFPLAHTIRGECILIFGPPPIDTQHVDEKLEQALFFVKQLVESGISMREAVEKTAKYGAISKNRLYDAAIASKSENWHLM